MVMIDSHKEKNVKLGWIQDAWLKNDKNVFTVALEINDTKQSAAISFDWGRHELEEQASQSVEQAEKDISLIR